MGIDLPIPPPVGAAALRDGGGACDVPASAATNASGLGSSGFGSSGFGSSSSLANSSGEALTQECVAGCCHGAEGCFCRFGFGGAHCERELRCAIVPAGRPSFATAPCFTHVHPTGDRVRCTCHELGAGKPRGGRFER